MTHRWELDLDDADEGVGAEFGLENRDEVDAINEYVNGLIPKVEADKIAGKISGSAYSKWLELKTNWSDWYQKVIGSWYVSDEDAAYARKKRDDINALLDPAGVAYIKATAHEKKIAATPKEYQKLMEEDQPWWRRNLGFLLSGTGAMIAGTVAVAYVAGPAIIKAIGKAIKH